MKSRLTDLQHQFDQAELDGDAKTFERLMADDFQAIGHQGFLFDKAAWIARHARVSCQAMTTSHLDVRTYGETAIIGQVQISEYRDGDEDARLVARVSHVWVRIDEWRLVAMQFSAIDCEGHSDSGVAGSLLP